MFPFTRPLFSNNTYLVLFYLAAMFQMFFMSCIIVGYSSLLVIFKKEGFYSYLCRGNITINNSSSSLSALGNPVPDGCLAQLERYNLVFTVAVSSLNLVKLPVGNFVDLIGARSSQYVGALFHVIGGVLLAYTQQGREGMLFGAFISASISASFIFISTIKVANVVFLKHKSLYLCMLSGCLDSAAVVYLLFLIVYNSGYGLRSITIFYTYSCLIVLILVTVFLYPKTSEIKEILALKEKMLIQSEDLENEKRKQESNYLKKNPKRPVESGKHILQEAENMRKREEVGDGYIVRYDRSRHDLEYSTSISMSMSLSQSFHESYSDSGRYYVDSGRYQPGHKYTSPMEVLKKLRKKQGREQEPLIVKEKEDPCGIGCVREGPPISESLKSPLFYLAIYFQSTVSLKLWFFIGNIESYLTEITDEQSVDFYILTFGFIQLSGFVLSPLIGLMFVRNELCKKPDNTEQVKLSAAEFRVKSIEDCILPAIVTTTLHLIFCVLPLFENITILIPTYILFAMVQSFMWAFSTAFYGLVFPPQHYGTLFSIQIMVSGIVCFLEFPMLKLTNNMFDGRQFWTNVIFSIMAVTVNVLPAYIIYYVRSEKRKLRQARK